MSENHDPMQLRDWLRSPRVLQALARRRWTIVYSLCGLILALSFLILGFWRTLLIAGLVYIGRLAGGWRDRDPRIMDRLQRLYNYWILENPFMK
jgi:uncharacterized membrane protein